MDESADKNSKQPEGENSGASSAGAASENNLPVIWSPKLGAGDDGAGSQDRAAQSAQSSAAGEANTRTEPSTAAAPAPRSAWRSARLAAGIALAAAIGSFAGALGGYTLERALATSASSAPNTRVTDNSGIVRAMKSETSELAAMKGSLDGGLRNNNMQLAALADRLDRLERSVADPAAATKLAHIAEAIDRLGKSNDGSDITGSIGAGAPAASAAPGGAPEPKTADRVLKDWIVDDVRRDRALVESRFGGLFAVGAGSVLPGLGRVEAVKRQDGQWIVVTARGIITSGH